MCSGGQVNSDLASKGFSNTDLSPYNSKFTVLRFSQQKSTSSNGKNGTGSCLRPFELSPEQQLPSMYDNATMEQSVSS